MQLWAIAKTGNFGPSGNQRLMVKVGTDARNYYFYQTKLSNAIGNGMVNPNDWLPQLTVDFAKWFDLKAKAELALIRGELTRPAPDQPFVMYSEDSTYGIVFEDRARAPNLAAVRELAFGVYNGSTNTESGEVWLNDIRLASAFRDPGVAGNMALDIRGGDFIAANLTYANQGALFRQLNQDASYLGNGDLSFNTTAQLGQLLPASWGLEMPITVGHARNTLDPQLLEASDVEAARLPGLRETGSNVTRVGLSVRKRTPSANSIISTLLDPLTLRVNYNKGSSSAITLRNEADGLDGSLSYMREVRNRDVDIMPKFLEGALRLLAPLSVEGSEFFARLTGARLRFTPVRVHFSTTYYGQERRAFQYTSILVSDSDAVIVPIESPRKTIDGDLIVAFQPFNSLVADFALRTSRDLLPTERATNQEITQSAIEDARNQLGGVDLGWETNRSMTSQLNFKPVVASWLRPSATLSTRFGTDRSTSYLEIITVGADSTAILQRRFQADRQLRRQLDFVPYGFYQTLFKDTTGFAGTVGRTLRALQPITLAWSSSLGSQFDRNSRTPTIAYQLALGDLERFRFMGIDSAAAATETGRFDATTSVRFLRSAQLDVQYANTELQAFDQRGGLIRINLIVTIFNGETK
jgi:cell surface protein SprA